LTKYGLDASCSGWGPVVGSCEHSNEPLGSIKGGEFLEGLCSMELIMVRLYILSMYKVQVREKALTHHILSK